ncbi:MAG: FadR family transcriptional regulator, partial [Mesorhizobium sp.]
MRDAKPNNEKRPTKAASAERMAGVRRPDAPRIPGASVHTSLASEIGLRIVRGDYPPGTI